MDENPWLPQIDIFKRFVLLAVDSIESATSVAGDTGLRTEWNELQLVLSMLSAIAQRNLTGPEPHLPAAEPPEDARMADLFAATE